MNIRQRWLAENHHPALSVNYPGQIKHLNRIRMTTPVFLCMSHPPMPTSSTVTWIARQRTSNLFLFGRYVAIFKDPSHPLPQWSYFSKTDMHFQPSSRLRWTRYPFRVLPFHVSECSLLGPSPIPLGGTK